MTDPTLDGLLDELSNAIVDFHALDNVDRDQRRVLVARDAIHQHLQDALQAECDAWASLVHDMSPVGMKTMRNALHQASAKIRARSSTTQGA